MTSPSIPGAVNCWFSDFNTPPVFPLTTTSPMILVFRGSMELHVAEKLSSYPEDCEAPCSFHAADFWLFVVPKLFRRYNRMNNQRLIFDYNSRRKKVDIRSDI